MKRQFRITLEQLMFATIVVTAANEDAATEIALARFHEAPNIFGEPTPEGWDIDSRDVEFHCADVITKGGRS